MDSEAPHDPSVRELEERILGLLAHRARLLREGDAPGGVDPADFGLPVDLWKRIDPAPAATRRLAPAAEPKRVVIVGGGGMMGRFFGHRLGEAGHAALALEQDGWGQAPALLSGADLVLVAVPIDSTDEVIRRLGPLLPETAALADLTSIKAPYLDAMLRAHRGPVMGLHPMFGPGAESFLAQRVVACPGRGDEAFDWLLDLIEEDGGIVVRASAEEHDHLMTAIQAIRHFATFSLGVFLADEGFDPARTLAFSSPIYRLELDMVGRLFAQDPGLYVDIMLATEERRAAIARFAANATRLAGIVDRADRDGLIRRFAETSGRFGAETERALAESAEVIRALSRILDAADGR